MEERLGPTKQGKLTSLLLTPVSHQNTRSKEEDNVCCLRILSELPLPALRRRPQATPSRRRRRSRGGRFPPQAAERPPPLLLPGKLLPLIPPKNYIFTNIFRSGPFRSMLIWYHQQFKESNQRIRAPKVSISENEHVDCDKKKSHLFYFLFLNFLKWDCVKRAFYILGFLP